MGLLYLYLYPPDCDSFKAVGRLDVWKFCLAWCLQKYLWFISVNELAAFADVSGVFLPRKL
jgi:hypothetical protein